MGPPERHVPIPTVTLVRLVGSRHDVCAVAVSISAATMVKSSARGYASHQVQTVTIIVWAPSADSVGLQVMHDVGSICELGDDHILGNRASVCGCAFSLSVVLVLAEHDPFCADTTRIALPLSVDSGVRVFVTERDPGSRRGCHV